MMSEKERRRLVVMEQMVGGEVAEQDVAGWLGVSVRQVRRIKARYVRDGAAGLVHRSRGRRSNRGWAVGVREACLGVYRERLGGFGPTLAAEKLEEWGVAAVDHETMRRWLIADGQWQRRRKRGPHRQWRQRRARFGELVQVDGSHHDWFGTGEQRCLMNFVDDATGTTLGWMCEEETTAAAMQVLWTWIETYGIPQVLYCDRKTVYITDREPTAAEVLAGDEPLTAFGQACKKLGIRIMAAHSPQAKGRVERDHGVYQDRLVKELALRGITTVAGANTLLEGGFVAHLNVKFAKPPADRLDGHRPLTGDVELRDVFAFEETRSVANDWTIRYHNTWYQITGPKEGMPRPKATVMVRRRLDASVAILFKDRPLTFREVPVAARVVPPRVAASPPPPPTVPTPRPRPAADHPWNRPFSRRAQAARNLRAASLGQPDTTP